MSQPRLFVHSLPPALFGATLDPRVLAGLSHRALALAGPDDVVVTESPADAGFLAYLGALGRGPGRVVVPADRPGTLAERLLDDTTALIGLAGTHWTIEPYFAGEHEQRLAQRLGATLHGSTTGIAAHVNRKAQLSDLLRAAGLPDVPTLRATSRDVVDHTERLLASDPVIVRADVGIGGRGVWIVRALTDLCPLTRGVSVYGPDDVFLVQPFLPTRSSPNVQFDLLDDGVRLVGDSEQRLKNDIEHTGNVAPLRDPARDEVLRQGHALATEIASRGYRGYLGIDFIICTDDRVFAIEVNPRINTSSFGLLTSTFLGTGDATVLTLTGVPAPTLADFDALSAVLPEDVRYDADTGYGVFVLLPPSPLRRAVDLVVLGRDRDDVEARGRRVLELLETVARSEVPAT